MRAAFLSSTQMLVCVFYLDNPCSPEHTVNGPTTPAAGTHPSQMPSSQVDQELPCERSVSVVCLLLQLLRNVLLRRTKSTGHRLRVCECVWLTSASAIALSNAELYRCAKPLAIGLPCSEKSRYQRSDGTSSDKHA